MTLYYADSPSHDGGFERIRNVQRAGYTAEYIVVQTGSNYYFITRAKDAPSDLNEPAVLRAISPPMTEAGFKDFLRSRGLQNFRFQYSAND